MPRFLSQESKVFFWGLLRCNPCCHGESPHLCRFLRRVLPVRQPPHLWRGHCCYLDHRIVDGEPLIQLDSRVTVLPWISLFAVYSAENNERWWTTNCMPVARVCLWLSGKACLNLICLTSFVFNMREDAIVAVTVPSMRIISTLSPSMLPYPRHLHVSRFSP